MFVVNNKKAFTLTEALITLSIVAFLAILILPGLIKNSMDKAMISQLQNIVQSLDNAIQNDIIQTRATDITGTNIYKDTSNFFNKNFDTVKTGSNLFASEYRLLDGSTVNDLNSIISSSALLKNGAVIGLYADATLLASNEAYIYIDINGGKEPNILGVDMFMIPIAPSDNAANNIHFGEFGCRDDIEADIDDCKTSATDPNCYCLLERSGFDPDYLK